MPNKQSYRDIAIGVGVSGDLLPKRKEVLVGVSKYSHSEDADEESAFSLRIYQSLSKEIYKEYLGH